MAPFSKHEKVVKRILTGIKDYCIDTNDAEQFFKLFQEICENGKFLNENESYTSKFLNVDIPKIATIIIKSNPKNSFFQIYGKILKKIVSLIPKLLQTENTAFFDFVVVLLQDKYQPFFKIVDDFNRFTISKSYNNMIDSIIRNNFKESVSHYLQNERIFNLKRISVICSIASSIKQHKGVEFDFVNNAKEILFSIENYTKRLTKEDIREINEKDASLAFNSLRFLCSRAKEVETINYDQIQFELLLVKSDFLQQKYSALNSVNKLLQSNEENLQKICNLLEKTSFLSFAEENMHISLLNDLIYVVSTMDMKGYDCFNSIKNIWAFSSQVPTNLQKEVITSWKVMISQASSVFIDNFLEVFSGNYEMSYNFLLDLLCSISWRFTNEQRARIFNTLDSYYFLHIDDPKSKELLKALVVFSPNNLEILEKCINLIREEKCTDYAIALLKDSLCSADSQQVLDVLKLMAGMEPTNSSVYIDTLCTILLAVNVSIPENDYLNVLDSIEKFAEDEQETIIKCFAKLNKQFGLIPKIQRKMLQILCKGNKINGEKLMLIKAIVSKLKTEKIFNAVDPLWNLLFQTGDSCVADIVVDSYIPGNSAAFIANCLSNINTLGALLGIKSLLHLTEDGIDRNFYNILPRNNSNENLLFVNLVGRQLQKAILVPETISFKAFKMRISECILVEEESITLQINDIYLTESNFKVTNGMEVKVLFQNYCKELTVKKDLPSNILVNPPYSLRLIEVLKANNELSQSALDILYLIPTIQSEMDAAEAENVDWESFFDLSNVSLFLYRINIVSQLIDNKFTKFYEHGGVDKLLETIPKVTKIFGTSIEIFHIYDVFLKSIESDLFKHCSLSLKAKKEIVETVINAISNNMSIKEKSLSLLLKLEEFSHFNETGKINGLISVAMFDESYYVRQSAKNLISLADYETKKSVLLSLLPKSATNNCAEFFESFDSILSQNGDEKEFFEKLFNVLKENCTLPDNVHQQIQFKTPSVTFIYFVFKAFTTIFSNIDDVDNYLEFFSFIIDNILFCNTKYYDLSKPFLDLVQNLCKKHEDVQKLMIERLKKVHEFCLSNKVSSNASLSSLRFKGLRNMGATCYMNATLQQLFHIPEFRDLFLSLSLEKDWQVSLQKLFAMLDFAPYSFINTEEFVKTWKGADGSSINPHEQQDAVEFLQVLLTRLCDEVDSRFKDLFEGKITHTILGTSAEYESKSEEPFFTLTLDVKGHSCVEEGLSALLVPDIFEGENGYNCGEGIGKIDAERRHIITKAPPYLIMQLQRFEYNLETLTREKINTRYTFPTEIDISFITENVSETLYELVGIEVHNGTSQSGHYTTYHLTEDGWLTFNDSSVYICNRDKIVDYAAGGFDYIKETGTTIERQSNAYILFYKRKGFEGQTFDANEEVIDYVTKEISGVLLRNSIQQPQINEIILSLPKTEESINLIFNHLICMLQMSNIDKMTAYVDNVVQLATENDLMASLVLKSVNEAVDLMLVNNSHDTRFCYSTIVTAAMKRDKEGAKSFIKKLLQKIDDFSIINYWYNFDEFFIPFLHADLNEDLISHFLNLILAVIPQHNILYPSKCIMNRIRCSTIFEVISSIKWSSESKKKYAYSLLSLKFIQTWANCLNTPGFIKLIAKIIENEPQNSEILLENIKDAKFGMQILSTIFLIGCESQDSSILSFVKKQVTFRANSTSIFFRSVKDQIKGLNNERILMLFNDWITPGLLSPSIETREDCMQMVIAAFPREFSSSHKKSRKDKEKGVKIFEKLLGSIFEVAQTIDESNDCTLNEYFRLLEQVSINNGLVGEVIQSCDIFIEAMLPEMKNRKQKSKVIAVNFFNFVTRSVTTKYSNLLFNTVNIDSFLSVCSFMEANENIFMNLIDFIPSKYIEKLCKSEAFSVAIDCSDFTDHLSSMIFSLASIDYINVATAIFTEKHMKNAISVQKQSYLRLCWRLIKMFNEVSQIFYDSGAFDAILECQIFGNNFGSDLLKTLSRFIEAYFTINKGKTTFFGYAKTGSVQRRLESKFLNTQIVSLRNSSMFTTGKFHFLRSFIFIGGKLYDKIFYQLQKNNNTMVESVIESMPLKKQLSACKMISTYCNKAEMSVKSEILSKFFVLCLSESSLFTLSKCVLESDEKIDKKLARALCKATNRCKKLFNENFIKVINSVDDEEIIQNVLENAILVIERSEDYQIIGNTCSLLYYMKQTLHMHLPPITRDGKQIIEFFSSQESETMKSIGVKVQNIFQNQ